jgi:tRNA-binding EMAP/Myf-like protein
MKIPSDLVPQADNLFDVAKVAECVARGATTYQAIAEGIGKVERQGRYYRKAAEIIGFTESVGANHSKLTRLGAQWVAAQEPNKTAILTQATLSTHICQRLIPFLEARPKGVSRAQLLQFLDEVADLGGESMAPRRVSTIIHWLNECNIVSEQGGILKLKKLPDTIPFLDYSNNESEPILPTGWGLNDYIEHGKTFKKRSGITTVFVDQAKMERANASHQELVKLVAGRVKDAGAIPKSGKLIDLAATFKKENFIFEMKSLSGVNARSQVRQGISQLYEYRYLEQAKDAKLVLVVQSELSGDDSWMTDYVLEDRNINILWDGDGNLYCPKKLHDDFAFLQPIAV